jgi:hypothetical protein
VSARPQSEIAPTLPNNLEAERAIIGTILLQHAIPESVTTTLSPSDCFDVRHRRIFQTMLLLDVEQTPIDEITLKDCLDAQKLLDRAGGVAYIASLTDGRPSVSNVEFHARIVRAKSILRNVIHSAAAIQERAYNGEEANDLLKYARNKFSEIEETDKATAIRTYSPAELCALVDDPIDCLAYPLFFRGMITLLDGLPKAAGKTTLELHAILSMCRGETFLSRPTKKANVLLVSEENKRTLKLAIRRAGLAGEAEGVRLMPREEWSGTSWTNLIERIEQICMRDAIDVLIFDTFYAIIGLRGERENHTGEVDEATEPVKNLTAKLDLATVLNRHERKSQGDVGQSGKGSNALTGAADVVLRLQRMGKDYSTASRELEVLGRIDPDKLIIELSLGRYISHEHADTRVSVTQQSEELDKAIQANSAATIRELAKLTGIEKNRISKLAAKLGWTKARKPRGAPWSKS